MSTDMTTSELETRLRLPSAEERDYAPPGLRPSAQRGEVMAPDRAVRRIPWRASSILTAAAIGVVLLGGTMLLVVVRSDIQSGAPMSLGRASAAAALEVDPSAIVETPDGFVAARLRDDRVELVIAQPREDGGWLVRIIGTLIAGPFDDNSATSSVIVVGCGPEWGLTWSTFAIGIETNNGFTSAKPIGIVGAQGRASVVRDGQPWVVAFDPSSIGQGSTFKLYYGSLKIGGGTFPAVNMCGGVYR
jgi:hypothetical protein